MSNSNFYGLNADGSLDVMPGSTIDHTVNEAIGLAISRQEALKFEFNGVTVTVEADSNPELILRDWRRALNGYTEKTVGPKSKAELSVEELANDARIEAENQARRDAESARYQAEAKAHRDRVEARMANVPAMEFSDEAAWLTAKAANENDPYGAGILSYAERWARMMQLELSEGKTLDEVWDRTSHEADLEGMSGFSQSMATHLLTQTWVHGAELRRLHNAYWGSDSTEGTVNPAILNIRGEE